MRTAKLLMPSLAHDFAVPDDHTTNHGVRLNKPFSSASQLYCPEHQLRMRICRHGSELWSAEIEAFGFAEWFILIQPSLTI